MYSVRLSRLCNRDKEIRKSFSGVFDVVEFANQIEFDNKITFSCIVNTGGRGEEMGHWFCIYVDNKRKICSLFDSFGFRPHLYGPGLLKLLKRRHLLFNKRILQDFSSSSCGLYAIMVLYYLCRGQSLPRILAREFPTRNTRFNNEQKVSIFARNKFGINTETDLKKAATYKSDSIQFHSTLISSSNYV